MSDHTITWTHIGDSVHGHIACTAAADAPCRRGTVWGSDGSVGSYIDADHCLPAVLLNEHDVFEVQQFYAGPVDSHTPLHDGPVDVRWNGHDWEWEYADQPDPPRWSAADLVDDADGDFNCTATSQAADGGHECCRPVEHRGPHIAQALNAVAAVSIVAVWDTP